MSVEKRRREYRRPVAGRDRIAVRPAAGAVDRLDDAHGVPAFCAASSSWRRRPFVLDLVAALGDLGLARSARVAFLISAATSSNGVVFAGSISIDAHQHHAEASVDRRAHVARLEREGGIRNRGIDNRGLRHECRDRCRSAQAALGGDVLEPRAALDLLQRGLGASSSGNTICCTSRRSGVSNRAAFWS